MQRRETEITIVRWILRFWLYLNRWDEDPFFVCSYISDFKDGLNAKTVASAVFMFFAVLAPSIILGGILGESTNNRIGVIETLLGNAFVGIVYALFSGQPLSILGLTGPVLIYEKILFTMTL